MEELLSIRICKYCSKNLELCVAEGVQCVTCNESVHIRCLKRGSVPGGLTGDLFFKFVCQECSQTGAEQFERQKLSWLQVINLALYHMLKRSPGLARNGFFHWRNHIVTFIDKNWELLFPSDVKKKKKWIGTVAGRLSYYSTYVFLSGARHGFNKPAWWTLLYPKLSPYTVSQIYAIMLADKQRAKLKNEKKAMSDAEHFSTILLNIIKDDELVQTFTSIVGNDPSYDTSEEDSKKIFHPASSGSTSTISTNKRKNSTLLPSFNDGYPKKMVKSVDLFEENSNTYTSEESHEVKQIPLEVQIKVEPSKLKVRLLDPMCHYNTSLNNIARIKAQRLQIKLMGGIRKEMILSPYSGIYLKPYIWRDTEAFPNWLRLMAELQTVVNRSDPNFTLGARGPIDYTYVQPEHIPAINSLCNQFFWPGIDLTDTLQYPDFSCVALYKNLIIGFAFVVPDVKHTENYVSFMFTRPGWRNCGIGKFMIYHLIQTSLGKDLTLHVSINNPALFLYQKFGFKVENVVLDFYDKFYRNDVCESKHAFFCRLER